MVKRSVIIFLLLFSFSFVSAISLDVSTNIARGTIINDNDSPALIEFTIRNNDFSSNFEIYTFEKFRINPNEFSLDRGETKKITFEFYPIDSMKKNTGHIRVPY